jgi:hypothetical protein
MKKHDQQSKKVFAIVERSDDYSRTMSEAFFSKEAAENKLKRLKLASDVDESDFHYYVIELEVVGKPTTETNELMDLGDSSKFPPTIGTVMVFAARYAHNRQTAAAYAVVRALKQCWHKLNVSTRLQIFNESYEATYNHNDWQSLRDFAKED